jgi:hypothetical protein
LSDQYFFFAVVPKNQKTGRGDKAKNQAVK